MSKTIDVIIPIYNDLIRTRQCIESVIKEHNSTQRIILINDKSPDPEITKYLREIYKDSKDKYNLLLLENEENLGFVQTVNKGMSQSKVNDVILLNSDTVVTKNWVNKLHDKAYFKENIGSVSPFSNNATIFSYPTPTKHNDLLDGLSPEEMNELFEEAAGNNITSLPTVSGFCMYIKRKVINKVGLFDHETFGKGYGEENDFCVRAYYAGYRNVECQNTFIYHYDGASFGVKKKEMKKKASEKLLRKHQQFAIWLKHYQNNHPYRALLRKVDVLRYIKAEKPAMLFVVHGLGGGTINHVTDKAKYAEKHGWRAFILYPKGGGAQLTGSATEEAFNLSFEGNSWYEDLVNILKAINVQHIHYHHLYQHQEEIMELHNELDTKYDITLHDYYSFCPRFFMLNQENKFCGASGNSKDCRECLDVIVGNQCWMEKMSNLLKGARKIVAANSATKKNFNKYYKKIPVEVISHHNNYWAKRRIEELENNVIGDDIVIGIVGNIGPHKGSDILNSCIARSKKKKMPIKWVVMGNFPALNKKSNVNYIGPYKGLDDLEGKILDNKVNVVILLSVIPETYSHALSESWYLGRPVIAPNIGALADRIKKTGAGWIVKMPLNEEEICDTIVKIKINENDFNKKKNSINNHKPFIEYPWKEHYKDVVVGERKKFVKKELLSMVEQAALKVTVGTASSGRSGLAGKIGRKIKSKSPTLFFALKKVYRLVRK